MASKGPEQPCPRLWRCPVLPGRGTQGQAPRRRQGGHLGWGSGPSWHFNEILKATPGDGMCVCAPDNTPTSCGETSWTAWLLPQGPLGSGAEPRRGGSSAPKPPASHYVPAPPGAHRGWACGRNVVMPFVPLAKCFYSGPARSCLFQEAPGLFSFRLDCLCIFCECLCRWALFQVQPGAGLPGDGEVEVPGRRTPDRGVGPGPSGAPPPTSGVKSPDFPGLVLCLGGSRRW